MTYTSDRTYEAFIVLATFHDANIESNFGKKSFTVNGVKFEIQFARDALSVSSKHWKKTAKALGQPNAKNSMSVYRAIEKRFGISRMPFEAEGKGSSSAFFIS